jgi:hypothetical protein
MPMVCLFQVIFVLSWTCIKFSLFPLPDNTHVSCVRFPPWPWWCGSDEILSPPPIMHMVECVNKHKHACYEILKYTFTFGPKWQRWTTTVFISLTQLCYWLDFLTDQVWNLIVYYILGWPILHTCTQRQNEPYAKWLNTHPKLSKVVLFCEANTK